MWFNTFLYFFALEQMNLAAFRDKEEKHADLLLSAHEMKVYTFII